MSSGRAIGIGLLAAGTGLMALMLLWIGLSGAAGGGIVLGLMLVLVLAGPLIWAGLYVMGRQNPEAQEAAAFATKRRVLEADRLFREEMAVAFRGLADRPELRDLPLQELARELEAVRRRGGAWEDAVQLDDANLQTLRRYDDLIRERVRLLRDGSRAPAELTRELRQALDQREDLLRGRRAPELPPSELLAAREPRRGAAALDRLGVGDAVSHDTTDYLVDAVATYFDEGQRWKLLKLTKTGGDVPDRWLYLGPGAQQVALLEPSTETPRDGASGTAVVDVVSRAGNAEGVLVSYARSEAHGTLRIDERWPDGTQHAYSGELINADDLDVYI